MLQLLCALYGWGVGSCVCEREDAYIYVQRPEENLCVSITLCQHNVRCSRSLNPEVDWLQSPPTLCQGYKYTCYLLWLFTSFLRIWTQIFQPMQQVLLPTELSPQLSSSFSDRKLTYMKLKNVPYLKTGAWTRNIFGWNLEIMLSVECFVGFQPYWLWYSSQAMKCADIKHKVIYLDGCIPLYNP